MVKITESNFEEEVLQNQKQTLVDFYADWCGPCQMMAQVIEKIAKEAPDNTQIGKVNVDENQELAIKYDVESIPTLILFENGEEKKRLLGVRDKQEILDEMLKQKIEETAMPTLQIINIIASFVMDVIIQNFFRIYQLVIKSCYLKCINEKKMHIHRIFILRR